MIIYIVKAGARDSSYYESVEVLDDMEEKPKTYVGQRRKISKDRIGEINEGTLFGSFNMAVISKEHIQDAREKLIEHVYEYNLKEFTKYREAIDAINDYNLNSDVKFK